MDMSVQDRHKQVFKLWQLLARKLRGAVILTTAFNRLKNKLFIQGTTHKQSFLQEEERDYKPYFFII